MKSQRIKKRELSKIKDKKKTIFVENGSAKTNIIFFS